MGQRCPSVCYSATTALRCRRRYPRCRWWHPLPLPRREWRAGRVALGLTLGVWSVSYLARQALTWGSADVPFSPLGSFALEGIALAVIAIGAVLGWSLMALAALRDIEQATPAAPAQCAVIVPYTVPDQYAMEALAPAARVCNPSAAAGARPRRSSGVVARAARRLPPRPPGRRLGSVDFSRSFPRCCWLPSLRCGFRRNDGRRVGTGDGGLRRVTWYDAVILAEAAIAVPCGTCTQVGNAASCL